MDKLRRLGAVIAAFLFGPRLFGERPLLVDRPGDRAHALSIRPGQILGYRRNGAPIFAIGGGATTTTANVAGLIPAVIAADAFDVYVNAMRISPLAQERRELEGANVGDRVSIGTFADAGEAAELVETTAMVPVNLSATVGTFIVKELGKAVAYTRKAGRLSRAQLQTRAANAVGNAIARYVDRVLFSDSYNARTTGLDITSASTTDPMSLAKLRAGLARFGENRDNLVIVMKPAQHDRLLADSNLTNAAGFGGGDFVIREGRVTRLYGMDLVISSQTGTVTNGNGVNNIAAIVQRNHTLASAYSQRPEVDVDYNILAREYQVAATALWAGGLQDPTTFVAIHTTSD